MKLTAYGAARNVTGTQHLLEVAGKRVLLDCGLYQGRRKESERRNSKLPFDPASIDAVLLSHAHIDHSGSLPTLVKNGFRGRIFSTHATADLCEILLRDTAHIQSTTSSTSTREGRRGERLRSNPSTRRTMLSRRSRGSSVSTTTVPFASRPASRSRSATPGTYLVRRYSR